VLEGGGLYDAPYVPPSPKKKPSEKAGLLKSVMVMGVFKKTG
jgi:hypothetical protein